MHIELVEIENEKVKLVISKNKNGSTSKLYCEDIKDLELSDELLKTFNNCNCAINFYHCGGKCGEENRLS